MSEPAQQTPHAWLAAAQAEFGGTLHDDFLTGAQIDGCAASIMLVSDGLAIHPDAGSPKSRLHLASFAAGRLRDAPVKVHTVREAANDNWIARTGGVKHPAQGLDIFAWKASRFIGEPNPPEYLVDGVIELGIPAMVAAMGEVGKSFVLLELCRRVAYGASPIAPPILGGRVVQEGTAVFITGEDDARSIHRRLAALDPKGARHAEKGDKLIAVPMPSASPVVSPFWKAEKHELVETAAWQSFREQLLKITDLKVVVIDPLQLFASLPLNEDPAAGQFVCASVASLAAETGATIFFAHHMNKGARLINNLADARDGIRGTTALVDGVRLAYALWYGEQDKAKLTCKEARVLYQPNRVVHGGVVKANGAARRIMSTYIRSDMGLLIDQTVNLKSSAPEQGDLLTALVIAVEAAARCGLPFTKTGDAGLHKQKERLSEELQALGRNRIVELADAAIEAGRIVQAAAKGSPVAKWLDVPDGPFALGIGAFRPGAAVPE